MDNFFFLQCQNIFTKLQQFWKVSVCFDSYLQLYKRSTQKLFHWPAVLCLCFFFFSECLRKPVPMERWVFFFFILKTWSVAFSEVCQNQKNLQKHFWSKSFWTDCDWLCSSLSSPSIWGRETLWTMWTWWSLSVRSVFTNLYFFF